MVIKKAKSHLNDVNKREQKAADRTAENHHEMLSNWKMPDVSGLFNRLIAPWTYVKHRTQVKIHDFCQLSEHALSRVLYEVSPAG